MTNIPWERERLAAQGLQIRRREQWRAVFNYTNDRSCDIPASDFFLHVAVVDDPGDLVGTEDQVARNIERIGIERFPATGMSYNALAFNTGRLYEGQPLTRRGAHTVNDKRISSCPTHGGNLFTPYASSGRWNLNITVRALCLPQMPNDMVTTAQLHAAAKWAAAQIRSGLAKPSARWHGHRDVAWKDCPGIAFARIPDLDRLTDHYVKVGLGPAPEDDMSQAEVNELKQHIDAKDAALRRDLGVHIEAEANRDAGQTEQLTQLRTELGTQFTALRDDLGTHLQVMENALQRIETALASSEEEPT